MLVGQVTRVFDFKLSSGQVEKADNVAVFDEWLSEIIDLPSDIFTVGVRKKCDGFKPVRASRDINVLATWTAPDGMKFCFDEYAGPLPYSPANYLFAAKYPGVLWKDRETFVLWLVRKWLADNGDWFLPGGDTKAELFCVRGIDVCGAHAGMTSNVK